MKEITLVPFNTTNEYFFVHYQDKVHIVKIGDLQQKIEELC